MNKLSKPDYEFEYVAGDLSLDFANTISGDLRARYDEHLLSYSDLVHWAQGAGVLDPDQTQDFLTRAQKAPEKAALILERVIKIREAINAIFGAVAEGDSPNLRYLETLNQALARYLWRQQLHFVSGTPHLGWDLSGDELDGFMAPVIGAAVELLTSDNINLVKVCGGNSCGWLFLDKTKNHSRRWCTMKDCGNVAKVRRFRSKTVS